MAKSGFMAYIPPIRPWSYPLSLMPMLLAACFIYKQGGSVDWPLFLLMVVTVWFIQAAVIMSNTYYDYINGVDGPGSYDTCLVDGTWTTKQYVWMIVVSIGCSMLGIAMVLEVSPARPEHVLAAYITSAFITLNYTGGLGLKYFAMGELCIMTTVGAPVLIYVSQGIALSWILVLYTTPTTMMWEGMMQSNNARDLVDDAKAGITTLAMLIGKRWTGVLFTIFLLVIPFTAACVLTVTASTWFLMPVLTIVPALKCWRRFYQEQHHGLLPTIAVTVVLPFGLFYIAACVLTPADQLPGVLTTRMV